MNNKTTANTFASAGSSNSTDEPANAETTHFGYQQIPADEKANRVGEVFDSVASRYDVMNDLMSFGVHRAWKRIAIEHTSVRAGHRVLDLAGGTGDLAIKLSRRVGATGEVVLADINNAMLEQGRDRLINKGITDNVTYAQVNAETLPFDDETFDCVTMAFGLRNVTNKDQALASIFRVLKPGGRVVILEFSKPVLPLLGKAYDLYSFTALPVMGQLVANDASSYRYLAESIRMHPDQDTLAGMMRDAGYEDVSFQNMTGGIVALHKGFRFD